MLQDTSRAAWDSIQPKLGAKQKEIYDVLRLLPDATNAELAARLGWPINTVTPRVKELREMNLVMDAGKRTCRITGSTAHAWRAAAPILPPAVKPVEPKPQTQMLFIQ